MDPLSSSLDNLARHAKQAPDGLAVEYFGLQFTWQKFHEDALRATAALGKLGIREGRIVAIEHPNLYLHWLILIGLEALGAVSASFLASEKDEGPVLLDLLNLADHVLCHDGVPEMGARQHLLDKDWLRSVFDSTASSAFAVTPLLADDERAVRLVRSSGTTAKPKLILMTASMQDYWVRHVQEIEDYSSQSGLLIAYPFTVNAVFCRATACLRRGGVTIFNRLQDGLDNPGITHLWLLPGLLEEMLDALPTKGRNLAHLRLTTGGGAVSKSLRAKAAQRLGCEILCGYGANEAGSAICRIDPDGVGGPYPGVGLRLVDERLVIVPEHEVGEIELRTPGMAKGYLNDPDLTAQSFKDGWFKTGNLAERLDGGRFRLIGRRDDMMNFKGVKLAPTAIESQILEHVSGLQDVAVVSIQDSEPCEHMHIAVILKPGVKLSALSQKIAKIVPIAAGKVMMKSVAALPKTANGKLRRQAVRDLFSNQTSA